MDFSSDEYEVYDGGSGRIPTIRFTTAAVPRGNRFTAWQRMIESLFDAEPRPASGPDTFSAAMTSYHFGRFLLCQSRVDGVSYRRSEERVHRSDLDHYLIHLPLHRAVRFGRAGGGKRVRPMEGGVLDLSRAADFHAAAGEAITLLVPRGALAPLLKSPGHQHGRILSRETPVGAFLARHLMALAVAAPRLGRVEASTVSAPILALVAACLDLGAEGDALSPVLGRHDLVRRVRAHIEQNLHREELTPASLAKDLGVSRSQLYRQFEGAGGVWHYIRQRRLRRCLLILCNPSHGNRRIADVAYDHGFADEAHFSRLFRQAFGLSPRAARTAARHGDRSVLAALTPTSGEASPFAHWVRDLAV